MTLIRVKVVFILKNKVAVLLGQQAKHDTAVPHYTPKKNVVIGCEACSVHNTILKAVIAIREWNFNLDVIILDFRGKMINRSARSLSMKLP